MVADGPISEGGGKPDSSGCLIVFGLVFACVGLGILIFAAASALFALDAASWEETPCRILSATLEKSHTEDSTKYRADFTYAYQFGGKEYVGERDAASENFGPWKPANDLLKSLPVGTETVCHVDPNEPTESVLDATFPLWYVLWVSLFGLTFGGIGGATTYVAFKARRADKTRRAEQLGATGRVEASSRSSEYFQTDVIDRDDDPGRLSQTSDLSGVLKSARGHGGAAVYPADAEDRKADVPQKVKAESSRLATLAGVTLIAVFWNGVVSVLGFGMLTDGPGGWMSLFIGLFLVPFVLIGLLLIAGVFHSFVSLFNPRVSIALSTGAVARGDDIDIAWEVSKGIRNIDCLRISIVGTEWARYQRGTDTIVDESTFEVVPAISTSDASEIRFGSATVTIPRETMHTLEHKNNKIKWAVVVSGSIAWWPDVSGNFPFRVMPGPQTRDNITLTTTAGLNDE